MLSLVEGMRVNRTMMNLHVSAFATVLGRELGNLLDFNRAQDSQVQKLTYEDVLKDPKAKGALNRTKLMFIGQGKAGKTATVRALLGQPFESKWKSTIAAALKEAKISNKLGWADVPKENRYEFTRDFAAGIAAKEIEEKEAKDKKLEPEKPGEVPEFQEGEEKDKFIVGTNLKGEEEIMATEDKLVIDQIPISAHRRDSEIEEGVIAAPLQGYQEYARQFDNDLIKDAREDKDSLKFTLWDYGGQRIFYSLHHLFLSKHGIYVLIFNMTQMLQQPGVIILINGLSTLLLCIFSSAEFTFNFG